MFKRFAFAAVAAAVFVFCAPPASAADHRDAPTTTIDEYSAIDINDVFMFRDPPCTTAKCTSPNLVVALSTQALADPQFGSSYHFQDDALYRLNFTTKKDARPTAHIDFVFGPFGNGPDCPLPQPACQTYKAFFPDHTVIEGLTTQGTSAATHNAPVVTTAGDKKMFAGPREDPFFFDLVGFNRTIGSNPTAVSFTGVDAFEGKNINAIVVEFPVKMVFPQNTCAGSTTPVFSTPCGVWAVTYLGNLRIDDNGRFDEHSDDDLRQVDRMGNPAVNTALIPAAMKDAFNFGQPKNDPSDFATVILDQIASLDAKFCPLHPMDCKTPNPNIPLLASVAVPDVLRFASQQPDGYPNGRQLADRTTDILISLILQLPGFSDGTNVKTYCSLFPFLGPPLQLSGNSPFEINSQSCP
jgi:uncharacterized protein DUF4331